MLIHPSNPTQPQRYGAFMLMSIAILLLALAHTGCDAKLDTGLFPWKVWSLDTVRSRLEQEKRDFVKIVDEQVGQGSLAAWGRRISADVDIRYADGSVVYKGPIVVYSGFHIALYNALMDSRLLSSTQDGIELGLNGMAVGGKRRITIEPEVVCQNPKDEGCLLLSDKFGHNPTLVRRERLIVEATLTESCAPVIFQALYKNGTHIINKQVWCRSLDAPRIDPAVPPWHVY
jgi:hypothetical protein